MRCTLGQALLLTPALLANAASPVHEPANEGPQLQLPHIYEAPPQPENPDKHPAPAPKKNPASDPASNPAPAPPEEAGPESDIYDVLTDILNAIGSIISLEAAASTVISPAGALPTTEPIEPTAALPCLYVYDLFDACASPDFYSDIAAATTQACDDGTCVAQTSSSDAAAATLQSSCLCYDIQDDGTSSYAPDEFNGYLGSCNHYVQAQTELVASHVAITTVFCTSATTTSMSITPTITPANSTTTSQPSSSSSSASTSAATVLSPMILFSGRWYLVWWAVIVLVRCGGGGYT